jgi:hypothetical protein
MRRLIGPAVVIVSFMLGWAGASVTRSVPWTSSEVTELRETVSRQQQQVATLQARLHARESVTPPRESGESAMVSTPRSRDVMSTTVTGSRATPDGQSRAAGPAAPAARPAVATNSTTSSPATVEAALDRFYKYLDAVGRNGNSGEGRERWQRARQLVEDLRGMGEVGSQALMSVLAGGTDSDERRAAARLLGQLQVPQSLPLLKDIVEKDDDLLLRRAAAAGIRQLQTADSIPVMEHILTNPNEDRFVRLSAAYGLAEAGQPQGVAGLTQIFVESTGDGRGRDMAFRALANLDDNRALPFMRSVLASQTEPSYRLRAIGYLTAQGDQQSLATLQVVMNSPNEQPSIRDAAARAYRTIGGK